MDGTMLALESALPSRWSGKSFVIHFMMSDLGGFSVGCKQTTTLGLPRLQGGNMSRLPELDDVPRYVTHTHMRGNNITQ